MVPEEVGQDHVDRSEMPFVMLALDIDLWSSWPSLVTLGLKDVHAKSFQEL